MERINARTTGTNLTRITAIVSDAMGSLSRSGRDSLFFKFSDARISLHYLSIESVELYPRAFVHAY
jgi:hypothetical protein